MRTAYKITIGVVFGVIGVVVCIVVIIVGVKTVASSRDQDKWIKTADTNAHHELDQFEPIARALASGSTNYTQLSRQLAFLQQEQINPATENNRKLLPQIVNVITYTNKFLGKEGDPEPGALSKIGLKSLVWFIDGIRDDKSYYLLDGAQLWAELRAKILQKQSGRAAQDLANELTSVQSKTVQVRDQLDGLAQIFVAGIKKMHAWDDDISRNLVQLRKVAAELAEASEQKQSFLDNTDALEKQVALLVQKYENKTA
jgi:hypothetical protein